MALAIKRLMGKKIYSRAMERAGPPYYFVAAIILSSPRVVCLESKVSCLISGTSFESRSFSDQS